MSNPIVSTISFQTITSDPQRLVDVIVSLDIDRNIVKVEARTGDGGFYDLNEADALNFQRYAELMLTDVRAKSEESNAGQTPSSS
jgi:hypothetical protein